MSTKRKYIDHFHPGVEALTPDHQGYLLSFNAGEQYPQFNDFISHKAFQCAEDGEGATYLVFDYISEKEKKLVAYYTIAASALPCIDREWDSESNTYDEAVMAYTAMEIKMFAVSEEYQDTFYRFGADEYHIASLILLSIIASAERMIKHLIGFKAIILNAVPWAISFYKNNGFYELEPYMQPFFNNDNECTTLYHPMRKITITYETK